MDEKRLAAKFNRIASNVMAMMEAAADRARFCSRYNKKFAALKEWQDKHEEVPFAEDAQGMHVSTVAYLRCG